jgi:uncharacterized protein (DUF2062 family)
MPFEMVPAAIGAILWRANLPLSLAWVWISNPLTWVPLWSPPYLLGTWLLKQPAVPIEELTLEVFAQSYVALWLGCLIFGLVAGTAGYYLVSLLWRSKVVNRWRRRREIRKARRIKASRPSVGGKSASLPTNEGN